MVYVHIELDNVSRTYFAGQVISGRIILKNSKPLLIKELTILLEGRGWVSWSEPRYYASETYVSQKTSLVGDDTTHIIEFNADGTNIFPFQFHIPRKVPSSFTSKSGCISYLLKAALRMPPLIPNKKTKLALTVISNVDLNTMLGALHPKRIHNVKGPSFNVGNVGRIELILKIGRSGFVPGEVVQFSCEVRNGSNRRIMGMKASLNQTAKFYVRGRTKTESKDVAWVTEGPEVNAGHVELWTPRNLCIPVVPPTFKNRLIEIQYFLHFELSITGVSSDMSADVPILIGTIPLTSYFDQTRRQSSAQIMPEQLPISCS